MLGTLPAVFPLLILLCQHMPASFTGTIARRLASGLKLNVIEVTSATALLPGRMHLGCGDADMVRTRLAGKVMVTSVPADPKRPWHPWVGRMMESALAVFPPAAAMPVMLTGMGNDGAEETSIVWGMPRALAELGGANEILPAHDIATKILSWLPIGRRAG